MIFRSQFFASGISSPACVFTPPKRQRAGRWNCVWVKNGKGRENIGDKGKKKNALVSPKEGGGPQVHQRCRWCTPRRAVDTLKLYPLSKGRAPTSWHICPRWSTVKHGFPTGSISGHRTAKRYPYSRQPSRQVLTSRDEPPRHWISPD